MTSARQSQTLWRFRFRLLILRIQYSRPGAMDLLNLVLALVGAWSVIVTATRLLSGSAPWASAGVGAVLTLALLAFYWRRLTRSPQDVFRVAARTEIATEELRRRLRSGMQNEAAYTALEELYAPLVDHLREHLGDVNWPADAQGRRVMVATVTAPQGQDVDDVIIGEPSRRPPEWHEKVGEFAGERQMFISTLRQTSTGSNNLGDEDGLNLVLDELCQGPQDKLQIKVSTASYGQIVRTSDALINEFALFGYISARSAFRGKPSTLDFRGDEVLRVLPWRRAVHEWDRAEDLLLRPRGRASGLGVAVVLAVGTDRTTTALMARRSSRVGTYPDVLHVIPAGMVNLRAEDVSHTSARLLPRLSMIAEFLEECFDVQELSGHTVGSTSKRIQVELKKVGLEGLGPRFLGVAIDLLNLRTELCGLIDMTDHAQAIDDFVISWEYTHTEPIRRVLVGEGAAAAQRTDSVQSGLGALHLAAQDLEQRTSARPPEPQAQAQPPSSGSGS